ncbi:HAD-IIIA family hydrolase [candidate division KSB1 bacterium]|nr:HAD-IIIA family hydrolase [candidate division KSB1 bacterium]
MQEKIKKIKLLLLDVDGVLTDGSIILGPSDSEYKIFNIRDGLGIKLAQAGGIEIGIITGRFSEAVRKRALELGIKILYQGQSDKIEAYQKIKQQLDLKDEQIAYIGDDLPDLAILKQVGFSCTVSDACDEIKKEVDFVTKRSGGKGAVREAIELILKNQGKWDSLVEKYIE